MPFVERPGGARIRYEVTGQGYPLLCFAPGGVSSQVEFWDRSVIKPHVDFSDEFMVIRMDQRNAGQSFAPLEPVSYELAAADQVAILDDLGIERAHVMGGCIGVAYVLRFIHDAPGRVAPGPVVPGRVVHRSAAPPLLLSGVPRQDGHAPAAVAIDVGRDGRSRAGSGGSSGASASDGPPSMLAARSAVAGSVAAAAATCWKRSRVSAGSAR